MKKIFLWVMLAVLSLSCKTSRSQDRGLAHEKSQENQNPLLNNTGITPLTPEDYPVTGFQVQMTKGNSGLVSITTETDSDYVGWQEYKTCNETSSQCTIGVIATSPTLIAPEPGNNTVQVRSCVPGILTASGNDTCGSWTTGEILAVSVPIVATAVLAAGAALVLANQKLRVKNSERITTVRAAQELSSCELSKTELPPVTIKEEPPPAAEKEEPPPAAEKEEPPPAAEKEELHAAAKIAVLGERDLDAVLAHLTAEVPEEPVVPPTPPDEIGEQLMNHDMGEFLMPQPVTDEHPHTALLNKVDLQRIHPDLQNIDLKLKELEEQTQQFSTHLDSLEQANRVKEAETEVSDAMRHIMGATALNAIVEAQSFDEKVHWYIQKFQYDHWIYKQSDPGWYELQELKDFEALVRRETMGSAQAFDRASFFHFLKKYEDLGKKVVFQKKRLENTRQFLRTQFLDKAKELFAQITAKPVSPMRAEVMKTLNTTIQAAELLLSRQDTLEKMLTAFTQTVGYLQAETSSGLTVLDKRDFAIKAISNMERDLVARVGELDLKTKDPKNGAKDTQDLIRNIHMISGAIEQRIEISTSLEEISAHYIRFEELLHLTFQDKGKEIQGRKNLEAKKEALAKFSEQLRGGSKAPSPKAQPKTKAQTDTTPSASNEDPFTGKTFEDENARKRFIQTLTAHIGTKGESLRESPPSKKLAGSLEALVTNVIGGGTLSLQGDCASAIYSKLRKDLFSYGQQISKLDSQRKAVLQMLPPAAH